MVLTVCFCYGQNPFSYNAFQDERRDDILIRYGQGSFCQRVENQILLYLQGLLLIDEFVKHSNLPFMRELRDIVHTLTLFGDLHDSKKSANFAPQL